MDLLNNSLMGQWLPSDLQGLQGLLHHLGTRGPVKWMPERGGYEKKNLGVANLMIMNHQTSYH